MVTVLTVAPSGRFVKPFPGYLDGRQISPWILVGMYACRFAHVTVWQPQYGVYTVLLFGRVHTEYSTECMYGGVGRKGV
jgi:hypothetical protein